METGHHDKDLTMLNLRQLSGLTRKQANRLEAISAVRERHIVDDISHELMKKGLLYDQGVDSPEIRLTDQGQQVLEKIHSYNEQLPARRRYKLSEPMVVALKKLATSGYFYATPSTRKALEKRGLISYQTGEVGRDYWQLTYVGEEVLSDLE